MIYLDTHVVIWFYAGDITRFPASARDVMNQHRWLISPIVRLELQYLHKIGRVTVPADTIISELADQVGLAVCPKPFDPIIQKAVEIDWTRDPFDRIIVAQSAIENNILLTSDQAIQARYQHAHW